MGEEEGRRTEGKKGRDEHDTGGCGGVGDGVGGDDGGVGCGGDVNGGRNVILPAKNMRFTKIRFMQM